MRVLAVPWSTSRAWRKPEAPRVGRITRGRSAPVYRFREDHVLSRSSAGFHSPHLQQTTVRVDCRGKARPRHGIIKFPLYGRISDHPSGAGLCGLVSGRGAAGRPGRPPPLRAAVHGDLHPVPGRRRFRMRPADHWSPPVPRIATNVQSGSRPCRGQYGRVRSHTAMSYFARTPLAASQWSDSCPHYVCERQSCRLASDSALSLRSRSPHCCNVYGRGVSNHVHPIAWSSS